MLSPGEAVIPAAMAKKYAPFINSIIADNVPGFIKGRSEFVSSGKTNFAHTGPEGVRATFAEASSAGLGNLSGQAGKLIEQGSVAAANEIVRILHGWGATIDAEINRKLAASPAARGAEGAIDYAPDPLQVKGAFEEQGAEAWRQGIEFGGEDFSRIEQSAKTFHGHMLDGLDEAVQNPKIEKIFDLDSQIEELERLGVPSAGERFTSVESIEKSAASKMDPNDPLMVARNKALDSVQGVRTNIPLNRQAQAEPGSEQDEFFDKWFTHDRKTGKRRGSKNVATEKPGGLGDMPQGDFTGSGLANADAYNDGLEQRVEDPRDVAARLAGRNSPHPEAFPDGADDAKAYMDGQKSVLGSGSDPYKGGSLAPPPPPSASEGKSRGGFFSRAKDKAKSLGNQAMDKFLETAPGQGVGNYFAETSGADITNSRGEVIASPKEQAPTQQAPRQYPPGQSPSEIQARNQALLDSKLATFDSDTGTMFATTTGKIAGLKDSFSVLDTEITELGNTAQDSASDVDKHTQSVRENGDAATQSSSEMDAAGGGGKRGRRGKKAKDPQAKRRGITGGGAGLSMGLSALTMGASMAPGALGEQAQKFMPALMALSAAPMLFQALQSPLVAVLAAIAAVAGAIFMLNEKMKGAQKEALELGKAMGSGADSMKELAEFAGTVSAGEFMDKTRENKMKGVETAPGKTTFGESFVQDEQGQALVAASKTQIAQTGGIDATVNALTSKLSTAVMTGVLTKEQASSMAANLGFALNNMEIGLQVRANISQMIGPNGEDISGGDLVEFSAKAIDTNLDQMDKQIAVMNNNLDGVFGDELSERVGGSIAAGITGGAIGAAVGSIVPGIGTAIGAAVGFGIGAIGGAVSAYFLMKDAAAEAGKLSGMVVATMVNALQQQQELADAVDAYYIKKIEEAKIQGDITEQMRLQAEYEQKKVEMSEQEMAMREKMRGALTGPGAEAAREGIDAAIETRFKDDADAQLVLGGIQTTLEDRGKFDEAEDAMISFELASGAISPQALATLIGFIGEDDAKRDALLNVFGEFGGVFADEAGQVMSLIDDEAVAADIFVKIGNAGNEQEAQEILDFVREIQKQDGVFDTDVVLKYMSENEDVAEDLQEIFDLADMGVVSTTQAYEINPELQNPEAFDELYFNMLPDADKEQYVKTISMILAMDETKLDANEDFIKWTGDEGAIHGPFPGQTHSLAAWERLYAESMGRKVTTEMPAFDGTVGDVEPEEEETSGGGGGGPQASSLDDLLKKLRDVRKSTIEMTEGWVESRHALDNLFDGGGEIKIFQGIEQQMRKIGAGEDLISMIVGMDPEEYERRKHELFQFDNMGNIIGATTALQNMGKALRAIALGDFQSEQQRVIGGINEQLVAFRKLTAAGLNAAMAYEAIKDAAFASAIAREQDNAVIRETIRLTAQAVTLNRALQAAQSVARKNQDTADLSGVLNFIEQNAASLSDAQKSAILNDPELQTLIMNPSVDPKTLRKALANASEQSELELRIKKLTFEGLQEIFQDGFSKAMEAFSAKETEIKLEFDIKKDPFLDIIQEAEEAIEDIRNRAGGIDDLEADIERISRQEEDINDAYDKRLEALDQIEKVNDSINRKKKSQLDVADALSQGDIAGAARAARAASQEAAEASLQDKRAQLDLAREQEIAKLTGNMGLTREQLEDRIKNLQIEIFNIEEQRLEPAERQVVLLDRAQAALVENLTVLGRTREEWEGIKNEVDLANVNSEKFLAAIEEALGVVDDIKTYWEDINGTEVDLFVNVRQQGSVEDIIASMVAGDPRPDPGSGGGRSDEDTAAEFVGKPLEGPFGRPVATGALEATRQPLLRNPITVREQSKADELDYEADRREQDVADFEQRLRDNYGTDDTEGLDQTVIDQIDALRQAAVDARAAADKAQADIDAKLAVNAIGDPMAVFNTGAANLAEAATFVLGNIARDADGIITTDIAGLFSDLGINAPLLMQGIPGFFDHLRATAPDKIEEMSNEAANFFNTLGANVGQNIGAVGEVLSKMSTTATDELGAELLAFNSEITTLPETWDAAGLQTWFQDLSLDAREALNDPSSPLAKAMFDLGIQSVEDLEGTLGTYWDVLPTTIGDIFEGEVTPFIEQQAAAMGISVEQFLGTSLAEIPEDIKAQWDSGFAERFNEFQVKAIGAIDGANEHMKTLGTRTDPTAKKIQEHIGNALRGAMLEGEDAYNEMKAEFAKFGSDAAIKAAFEDEDTGFAGAAARGAALAASSMDLVTDAVAAMPEHESVTGTLVDEFPEAFGASGTLSGDKFGQGAVDKMDEHLDGLEYTVTINFDTSGAPAGWSWDNDGGFVSSTPVLRNNGGLMPYGKGGMAKYAKGGMAKWLAGGVIGGFGNYDNVPAMLTPGEFVIRREAVQKYGKNFFAALNSTIYNKKPSFSTPSFETPRIESSSFESSEREKSPVMYNNNYSVSINVKSDSNPDQIARTVIDQIKRIDSQRIRGNRF
jgi:hypothetical protein